MEQKYKNALGQWIEIHDDTKEDVGVAAELISQIVIPEQVSDISISATQPANTFKLWIKTISDVPIIVSDVDILRAIRDANPQSTQLAALFDDSKDPHTEWWVPNGDAGTGALMGDNPYLSAFALFYGLILPTSLDPNKCYVIYFPLNDNISTININGINELVYLYCGSNNITTIDLSTNVNLQTLILISNLLESINILQIGHITYNDFSNNKLQQPEIDRLVALGFIADINNQNF